MPREALDTGRVVSVIERLGLETPPRISAASIKSLFAKKFQHPKRAVAFGRAVLPQGSIT
jgi:hypothetical protein